MNWDGITAIAEIVGTIAVVISFIYVAAQIRQNTKTMQSASAQSLTEVSVNGHFLMGSNSELARVIQRGITDPASLEDYEQLQMNSMFLGLYAQYDFAYRQLLRGELETGTWERMKYEMLVFLKTPAGELWWSKDKVRMSPEFASFIDSELAEFATPETFPTLGTNTSGPPPNKSLETDA